MFTDTEKLKNPIRTNFDSITESKSDEVFGPWWDEYEKTLIPPTMESFENNTTDVNEKQEENLIENDSKKENEMEVETTTNSQTQTIIKNENEVKENENTNENEVKENENTELDLLTRFNTENHVKILNAREALKKGFPPTEYLIDGCIAKSKDSKFIVLAGQPKCGKSTIASQMMLSVVSGADFLSNPAFKINEKDVEKKGLWISYEEHSKKILERINEQLDIMIENDLVQEEEKQNILDRIHVVGSENTFDFMELSEGGKGDFGHYRKVEDYIDKLEPSLIIIDSYTRLNATVKCDDIYKPNATTQICGPICHLAEKDAEVLLLCHTTKAESYSNKMLNIQGGNNAFQANAKTCLYIKKTEKVFGVCASNDFEEVEYNMDIDYPIYTITSVVSDEDEIPEWFDKMNSIYPYLNKGLTFAQIAYKIGEIDFDPTAQMTDEEKEEKRKVEKNLSAFVKRYIKSYEVRIGNKNVSSSTATQEEND